MPSSVRALTVSRFTQYSRCEWVPPDQFIKETPNNRTNEYEQRIATFRMFLDLIIKPCHQHDSVFDKAGFIPPRQFIEDSLLWNETASK